MKKYRFLSLLLAVLMALPLTAPAAALEDPRPHAKAAIVVYGDTGEVLYDFNARQRMYPASITKIMTSLVVLDAVKNGELTLDTPVTASAQAVNLPLGSSTADIKAGETLTIEQLLYCDLLPSGNDACNILAEALAGTTAEFAARMNAKAQELGMKDTNFTNPHGLHDPEHYTTAYDIYLMARAAMDNDTFRAIVRSPSYTIPATNMQPERTIYTTNGLLGSWYFTGYLYSKAIGIKTGNTRRRAAAWPPPPWTSWAAPSTAWCWAPRRSPTRRGSGTTSTCPSPSVCWSGPSKTSAGSPCWTRTRRT